MRRLHISQQIRLRPDDADRQRRASRRPFCGCCGARTFLLVARSIDAPAAAVSGWREVFLETGASGLKHRAGDVRDEESDRLRAKVGEIAMDNERLYEKIAKREAGHPFGRRRSKDERRHLDLHGQGPGCITGVPVLGLSRASVYPACTGTCKRPRLRPSRSRRPGPQGPLSDASVGCELGRRDQAGHHGQQVPWRGLSQGLGAPALQGHPHLTGAGSAAHARERAVCEALPRASTGSSRP